MLGTKTDNTHKLNQPVKLSFYQRIIDFVFKPMTKGQLTIVLPNGEELYYGSGVDGPFALISVNDNVFFKKCVLYGDVGFGESYVDGDWDTDSIRDVIEWMITNVDNHPTLMDRKEKRKPVNFLRIANNLVNIIRKNSLNGSRQNIHDHYDLGNDFFQLFLDSTMTYSSAYFTNAKQSLEEAQYQKYEELCQKLQLKERDHLLEIGSGWGGFACYAAKNFGTKVTTTTISQEQYKFASERIKNEGLSDKVEIILKDYRDLTGVYNKIVSIEMLEAVGHDYYEAYFAKCHDLLDKNGVLALQVILSPDHRYHSFRKNTDWIQKHIFPGSLLPSIGVLQDNIQKTGEMNLHDFEDMTAHYVKTLDLWFQKFNLKIDDILKLGLDQTFIRKWNYYWCYCMAAFHTRNITVAQLVYTRPNNTSIRNNL